MFLSTAPMPLPMVAGDEAASYGCVAWRAAARAAGAAQARAALWASVGRAPDAAMRSGRPRPRVDTFPAGERLPGGEQACGQSTALIWFGFDF